MTLAGMLLVFYATIVTVALTIVSALLYSARIAIKNYKRMIEETRRGEPPFLLDHGVSIVRW